MTRALVWGSFDVGSGPRHPNDTPPPSSEPWVCAQLMDEDAHSVMAEMWMADVNGRVFADFSFHDALSGTIDAAVLPLLVEGFFGENGHTLGYYRKREKFPLVRLANLRTGTSWEMGWDALDELVAEMKASSQFRPREMR